LVCGTAQQHSVMLPEIGGRLVSSAGILINLKALMVQPSGSGSLEVPARPREAQDVIEYIKSLPDAGSKTVFQSKL